MGRRILDALFTAVVLVLAIPTILIIVSWSAIPGDNLYPLKSGLENVVLLVFSGTPLVPQVSMKFTDRRLGEATKLLDKKGSTVGYTLLVANAKQTQNYISEKSDVQSAVQFSKNIDGYKKEIEKKKTEVKAEIASGTSTVALRPSATPVSARTPGSVAVPVPTPTPEPVTVTIPETSVNTTGQTVVVNVPQEVTITHEDPEEVLQTLNETEDLLDQIQQEVNGGETRIMATTTATVTGTVTGTEIVDFIAS